MAAAVCGGRVAAAAAACAASEEVGALVEYEAAVLPPYKLPASTALFWSDLDIKLATLPLAEAELTAAGGT